MPVRSLALAAALAVLALPAAAQDGDAEKGKSQFGQCRACHTVENGQNRVGPHLFAVVGRKAGAVEKYAYSEGIKGIAEQGIVWDEPNLMEYLADPNAYLKKMLKKDSVANKMPNKFPDEALRKNVIAYLKTIK
jgi:cytochrome c